MTQDGSYGNLPSPQADGHGPTMVTHNIYEPALISRTPPTADTLISIREIRQLFALGRTAAYELTHRPDFPAPVRISSRCYRWWAGEVTAFAVSLREQANASRQDSGRRRARQAPSDQDAPTQRITGKVRVARTRGKRRD